MRLFILPILYRKQEKSVVCDSFLGIKKSGNLVLRSPVILMVIAINQNLSFIILFKPLSYTIIII